MQLKWKKVPCITIDVPKEELYEYALAETLHRNGMDKSKRQAAYKVLLKKYKTVKKLAEALHLPISAII